MKAAFTVLAIGATLVAAQDLASLPPCGQTCVNNMLALAPSLGCPDAQADCLCRNVDFGYGVRDCANQACPDASAAQQVIAYGTQYCGGALGGEGGASAAGAGGASSSAFGTESGATPSATESSTEGGAGGAVAITTSALTALVSGTDTSFVTTTGFTTIFDTSMGGAMPTGTNSEGQTTDSAGNVVSATETQSPTNAEESASAAASSITSAAGSAASSISEGVVGSATGSGNGAAMMTAAPMLAAGVLAMLAL
ncbi:hypothetical protein CERZMDRAFT_120495 [Cercospora zeae-maydis SCOH1-5]|uniref:CFEM domain-containing protein n=1 Tax=Cercospora zeae-maydis SCOH1-5 TaxID=717836 RepID=A0A6A6FNJ5_9PEZI|nr:hypothetical protein CERZMDRAFT_120495 [Cercospora zeae-maydis SCOH1-5]